MQRAPFLHEQDLHKQDLVYQIYEINIQVYALQLYTAIIQLFCLQGQDIYKSKQVRDKQIARILGKVCSQSPILAFLGPSIASLLTPSYVLHMKASASVV